LVVAAFASWHENHEAARRVLDGGLRLIEHCALETYSVLTRLPPPHRTSASVIRDFLKTRFPQPLLRLSVRAYRDFIFALPEHGVSGGAACDALVAATAAACRTDLVSCDRRALPVYERYGVRIQLIA
jgi:predicted nucleic acid-binding protein